MSTAISPVAPYRTADGTELPLRELTLHPSDDAARAAVRIMEEYTDAAESFRKVATASTKPEERKNATLYAAEMRNHRDKVFRDEFVPAYWPTASEHDFSKGCGDQ